MQFSSLTLNWARPRESATAQSLSLSHSFTHIHTHQPERDAFTWSFFKAKVLEGKLCWEGVVLSHPPLLLSFPVFFFFFS